MARLPQKRAIVILRNGMPACDRADETMPWQLLVDDQPEIGEYLFLTDRTLKE